MGPLLSRLGNIMTKDMEKAKALNAFFDSIFW